MHRRVLLVLLALATPVIAAPPPAPPDFKIAYWYRRKDPIDTLRFQVYDLRKGEYNSSVVESWLARIGRDYPGYRAYVRDIRISPGETAEQKVAGAIMAEHLLLGGTSLGLEGLYVHEVLGPKRMGLRDRSPGLDFGIGGIGGAPRSSISGFARPLRSLPGVGGGPLFPPPPYPMPFPYPRPHP